MTHAHLVRTDARALLTSQCSAHALRTGKEIFLQLLSSFLMFSVPVSFLFFLSNTFCFCTSLSRSTFTKVLLLLLLSFAHCYLSIHVWKTSAQWVDFIVAINGPHVCLLHVFIYTCATRIPCRLVSRARRISAWIGLCTRSLRLWSEQWWIWLEKPITCSRVIG